MRLAVISPADEDPREPEAIAALLAAGLERYHVRKPGWPAERLAAWARSLPAALRPRLALHGPAELAAELGFGGCHGGEPGAAHPAGLWRSRSCHDLGELRGALGRWDAVWFGPVFPSISKPGRGPGAFPPEALAALLAGRSPAERRTAVFALGGVTAERLPRCRDLGFDGALALGAIWRASDPATEFRRLRAAALPPVLGITQEGLELPPAEQAERLAAAGAGWVQLRMKQASPPELLAAARRAAAACRAHGARCIVNDSVEAALAAGADGVHLGSEDMDWREARRRLGPALLLGGTVNHAADADRALAAGCLDYVGVGPLRFTATKRKLAPVLGPEGVAALIRRLEGLPAWVIGGVLPEDLPALRASGAAGVAVASALFRGGAPEANLSAFRSAWTAEPALA